MKIDRLIGIISVLQQKGQVTAPYLAEKFEVSRRTISRDIESICLAGIPIVTTQGAGGGVRLMDGFALDTTVFTQEELQAIFTGIQSLDSVSRAPRLPNIAQKMGALPAEDIVIDLSSFYKNSLAEKIELLRSAIREGRTVDFHYYYARGEADKRVDPYLIVFKWSDWYLYGYCHERQDFRLYKLRRLWQLAIAPERFQRRAMPAEEQRYGTHMTDDYFVTALFDPSVKYRLVE